MKSLNKNSKTDPLPSGNGNKKSELTVYLYNVVEDEWSFISALASPINQAKEIQDCQNSVDTFFLGYANGNDLLFVSSTEISTEFQQYAQNLTKYKNTEIVVVKPSSHLLCQDLANDEEKLKYIVDKARDYKKVTLISYATSPQFYDLKKAFLDHGLNVYTPETPEIDCGWTVNFFGSKSGIRQLAQKSAAVEPDFIMPEGVIVVGVFNAAKIAANKYLKEKGVVIKTNKGSGGDGLLIFRDGDLPKDYLSCEKQITHILRKEPYWEKFPIIVESLVNINYSIGNGYPNVEFKIQKNGRIDMLYYCTLAVTKDGAFLGIDIHEDVVSDRISTMIVDTGYYIAEQLSSAGYRGHFDIDMMAARNNKVYVCETNTRNTGGTDIFKLCVNLLGKDFYDNHYVISRTHYHLPKKIKYFEELLKSLQPILYSHKTKEGVIINSANRLLQQEMIYTIIGKNKKRAYGLHDQMQSLLSNLK